MEQVWKHVFHKHAEYMYILQMYMYILGGVQGPALGPLAGCRGRAPAGGPGGGAPGRFWIYAFQSPKIAVFEGHISHFLKG